MMRAGYVTHRTSVSLLEIGLLETKELLKTSLYELLLSGHECS